MLQQDLKRSCRLAAVIPAAGMSSRMGAFKPLLPFDGDTVIGHTVQAALGAADRVVVVLGNRAGEVRRTLTGRFGDRVVFAENPQYASTDMLRSVQLGLMQVGRCDGFFLLPGDMPAVRTDVFEALRAAFDGETELLCPVTGGRRGHPVLISSRLIPLILAYRGEGGLRAALSGCRTDEIAVDDSGVLTDLDTPGDYARLTAGRGQLPDEDSGGEGK